MFNGVEMNPTHLKMDWKLNTLRCSMLMLAMLNVLLVADNIVSSGGKVAPQLILASAFQVWFERLTSASKIWQGKDKDIRVFYFD